MTPATPLADRDLTRLRGLIARLEAPAAPDPRAPACAVPGCEHRHVAAERERPLAA